ncbi:sulfurtransferase complex subunit TusB [Alteromonadaceae bacterium M269]|nr:sulfurtransferase complex subunit TusB [Alteromonadaceae bacterium M269]
MPLHIIKQSPFDSPSLAQCKLTLSAGDAILFIENGIYCLNHTDSELQKLAENYSLYILSPDAETRGISNFPDYVTAIDYEEFVKLTIEFSASISW